MKHLNATARVARKPMALAAMTALIALAYFLSSDAESVAEDPLKPSSSPSSALAVEATQVEAVSWPTLIQASGVFAAKEEIHVVAEVSGVRLTEVRVDVGDRVQKGQQIAQLDDVELRSQKAELVAEVAKAASAWRNASLQLERSQQLDADAALSQQDLERLQMQMERAWAELESATARLDLKRIQIQRTRIVAPHGGVVSARSAALGTVTSTGQELFRVLRDNRLEWRAELTAAQLSQVRAGQRVTLTLPDGTISLGRVRQVAPTVDSRSRMGLAYVDIESGDQARAGMYAAGRVHVGKTDAMVLPASAMLVRDGRTSVAKIQRGDGVPRVSMVAVTVGRRQGRLVEVVDALQAGEEVVLSGAGLLGDGDQVRVISSASSALPVAKGGAQ
jgi:RND family efflux transporter MFP subunit